VCKDMEAVKAAALSCVTKECGEDVTNSTSPQTAPPLPIHSSTPPTTPHTNTPNQTRSCPPPKSSAPPSPAAATTRRSRQPPRR
jgi:hypothetical protein